MGYTSIGRTENNKRREKFKYEVVIDEDNSYLWEDHWYLLPFPVNEINKKYGLVQNPGW